MSEPATTPSAFDSLETFIGLPRVEGLALSPDGSRAMLIVATLSEDRTRFVRSLWAIPPRGDGPAVPLVAAVAGGAVAFSPSGDVLFVSPPEEKPSEDGPEHRPQLRRLPAGGGESRVVTYLAGGAGEIAAVAKDSDRIVITAPLLRSADSVSDDARRRAARAKRKIGAILHESYPVRVWDHDRGPAEPRLLALDLAELDDAIPDPAQAAARAEDRDGERSPWAYPTHLPTPVDITPHPGRTADLTGATLSRDGRTLIASILVQRPRGGRAAIVAIDTTTGEGTELFGQEGVHFEGPVLAHSGERLAFQRHTDNTPAGPNGWEIWVSDPDGSKARRLAAGWDRIAHGIVFAASDDALLVTADEAGRAPIFRIPLDDGPVTRLTADDFSYSAIAVDPSDGAVLALRSSVAVAPHPVRVDPDGTVTELATPAPPPAGTARVEEVETTAQDGVRIRGWLVLPKGASAQDPAPLLLWIHGGPLMSWSAWSWRWNPLLAAARGYAVLLPDPGLSTGYGLEFIARGWNAWGRAPYADLMAITDAVVARSDMDATRTGAMGASFGGYMTNWIAGHTDRFRAIVSHAGMWALDSFGRTTDQAAFWDQWFTPEGALANSPHRFAADICTPMLVVHGDRDYRVPVGEGIRLWADLTAHHSRDDGSTDHRYLYFPDESHWILTPQHTIVWWETMIAFLAQHVLDQEDERPDRLG